MAVFEETMFLLLKKSAIVLILVAGSLGWVDCAAGEHFNDFNQLLDGPPTARSAGMARAASSVVGDYAAVSVNPATLGFATCYELVSTLGRASSGFYADRVLYSVASIFPVSEESAFGAQLAYGAESEGFTRIPRGYFFVGRASAGIRLKPNLSVGASAEVVHDAQLWWPWFEGEAILSRATGWGLDGSLLYRTPVPTLNVSFSVLNLGPDVHYSEGDRCDRYDTWRVGISGKPVRTGKHEVVLSSDVSISRTVKNLRDMDKMYRFGAEYGHDAFFYVRAGHWRQTSYNHGFSAGGGLRALDWLSVDLAVDVPHCEYDPESEAYLTVSLTPPAARDVVK